MVPLMQIDCEVLDTHLLHVKYGSIPRHLRTPGNATQESTDNNVHHSNATQKTSYKVNNATYKPYFMRNSYLKFKDD